MLTFQLANRADTADILSVRLAAADKLTVKHGSGHWSLVSATTTIRKQIDTNLVYVARKDQIVGTYMLDKRKIGFYRKDWFAHPNDPSLYLTNMAVAPEFQLMGTGRAIMAEIERFAREQDRLAIRFDAYDSPAGAGPFYKKCGYERVHRGSVGYTTYTYFEKVLR